MQAANALTFTSTPNGTAPSNQPPGAPGAGTRSGRAKPTLAPACSRAGRGGTLTTATATGILTTTTTTTTTTTIAISTRPAYAGPDEPAPASLADLRKAAGKNDPEALSRAPARRAQATLGALLAGVTGAADLDACLRQAAARGSADTVRRLLEQGADVNSVDDAAGRPAALPHDGTGRHGHAHGRENMPDARPDGRGVLYPFAELAWADSLALIQAARNGHADTVRVLLAAGARVERGFYCQYLMVHAVASGHADIALMLLEARRRAPVDDRAGLSDFERDCVDRDMRHAFICTLGGDQALPVLAALLQTAEGRAMARSDPLVLACAVRCARPAVVGALLAAGADPDKSESEDLLPIVLAIEQRSRDSLEMLINAGARPGLARRHRNSNRTLLQHADAYGDAATVKFVLSLGMAACGGAADVNAALVDACGHRDAAEAAQPLRNAGASAGPNRESGDGRTPLYEASQ